MNEFSREITMDGVSGIWGWLIGGGILGLSIAVVIAALVCAFFWYIIRAVGYWKAFQKAGEPGWKALIPFYNTYTRYKLTWDAKMFWVSLALIIGGKRNPGNRQPSGLSPASGDCHRRAGRPRHELLQDRSGVWAWGRIRCGVVYFRAGLRADPWA